MIKYLIFNIEHVKCNSETLNELKNLGYILYGISKGNVKELNKNIKNSF